MPIAKIKLTPTVPPGKSIKLSTIVVTWNDGTARTATADVTGTFSGDATGEYIPYKNEINLAPTVLPTENTTFTMDYDVQDLISTSNNIQYYVSKNVDDTIDIDLSVFGSVPIEPESVFLQYKVSVNDAMSEEAQGYKGSINDKFVSVKFDAAGNAYQHPDADNPVANATFTGTGTVNYTTGLLHLDPLTTMDVPDVTTVTYTVFGESRKKVESEQLLTVNNVRPSAAYDYIIVTATALIGTTTTQTIEVASQVHVQVSNNRFSTDTVIPETVRIETSDNRVYIANNNDVIMNPDSDTGTGLIVGTLNKTTGQLAIDQWGGSEVNTSWIPYNAAKLLNAAKGVSSVSFRIPNAPVRVSSFDFQCETLEFLSIYNMKTRYTITAASDASGIIYGITPLDNINGGGSTSSNTVVINGTIDYETGVVEMTFGVYNGNGTTFFDLVSVDPATMAYNAVSQQSLPIDESILGLNPVRLPNDGRVPIYNKGDLVVIHNTQTTTNTFASNSTTNLGRLLICKISIVDVNGTVVPDTLYTVDLDLGIINWLDLSTITQPITIEDTIEDLAIINDVEVTGKLHLTKPLTHDYPVANTWVSNALVHGDMQAHTTNPFDQKVWTGEWSDILIGDQTLAEYNNAAHPIVVDNASCIEERWLVQFVSSTTVNVIGENKGQVLSGVSINNAIAPINPATGFPYFSIAPDGWGGGWSSGNLLRFNTIAANVPIWVIQSVGVGTATNTDPDALTYCLSFRGSRDTVI